MFKILKAYAEQTRTGGGARPSRTATEDDRRYTQWAVNSASTQANARVRNPQQYVNRNVRQNAPVARRRNVLAQVNR